MSLFLDFFMFCKIMWNLHTLKLELFYKVYKLWNRLNNWQYPNKTNPAGSGMQPRRARRQQLTRRVTSRFAWSAASRRRSIFSRPGDAPFYYAPSSPDLFYFFFSSITITFSQTKRTIVSCWEMLFPLFSFHAMSFFVAFKISTL